MDLKTVVKHLANSSLGSELCVVCLLPLTGDHFENIFTSICKKDEEYCIADVLREVCQIQITDTEHYYICSDCFQLASAAYTFYLQAKRSHKIINFYTNQLLSNIVDLEITKENSKRLLCIPLPIFTSETSSFDSLESRNIEDIKTNVTDETDIDNVKDDEFVMVVKDGETLLYSVPNGALENVQLQKDSDNDIVHEIVNEKIRKKRDPMTYISCLHCPVKYRFVAKLKEHEKKMHNAVIYYCKICKLIVDNKNVYEDHLSTHVGNYQCTICSAAYRKKSSLMKHLQYHEKSEGEKLVNGNICEICGVFLESESDLEAHRALRHVKRFTCYYCGKMYKGSLNFEIHIKKHEKYLKSYNKPHKNQESKSNPMTSEESNPSKRCICGVCGKSFVNERSLLWHQRLHNNDRPFVCNVCNRGFISVNRRNQHRICAHTLPSRRCPLCPALFHLRSLVNTHIKKVHLSKENKRRNRVSKHAEVFWRTETVPIQELCVSIQNEVMEIQSSQDQHWENLTAKKPQPPRKTIKAKSTATTKIYTEYTVDNKI